MSWQYAWKFRLLLVALLALLASQPLMGHNTLARLCYTSIWSLVLIITIFAISDVRWQRFVGLGLGLPILPAIWARHLLPAPVAEALEVPIFGVAAVFFGIVAVMVMRHLITYEVTADNVAGAVCAYLFLGLGIGALYAIIETLQPHSFQAAGSLAAELVDPLHRRSTLIYFSFVTLTTAGYGDVVPVTALTRTLAMLEAVLGQFYLAVLVAGLVGIRASRKSGSR
ncbi:MAG TPA: potassium channel family protein [Pirellulales bacterium]|nr:potassium channel family protein [Pirellulales bacterium]